jgi:hypothetical protein
MAAIVRISQGMKDMVLQIADHHCQCNVGHNCVTGVRKTSYFVSDGDVEEQIAKHHAANVKVVCKGCIDKGHHLHLKFLPSDPVVKVTEGGFGHRVLSIGW